MEDTDELTHLTFEDITGDGQMAQKLPFSILKNYLFQPFGHLLENLMTSAIWKVHRNFTETRVMARCVPRSFKFGCIREGDVLYKCRFIFSQPTKVSKNHSFIMIMNKKFVPVC